MTSQANGTKLLKEPLKYSGSLDKFKFFESTPVIGREYVDLQLTDLLKSPDRETLIRDLAITISRRGVCFFRNQDITAQGQKELVSLIGTLAGKPKTSGLHIHPQNFAPDARGINEQAEKDEGIFVITNAHGKRYRQDELLPLDFPPGSINWHTDISFETCPADYSCLRLRTVPPTGGDTVWASACEIYDRISPGLRAYLSTLTATHSDITIPADIKKKGYTIKSPRGAPENVGEHFSCDHPFVRTNPVTGWRSVYVIGRRPTVIKDTTPKETEILREYMMWLVTHNHDLQVRFKWNTGDVAIWDNRSVFHNLTPDVAELREGNRATSLGERPYFDPASKSRREALAEEHAAAAVAAGAAK